MKTSTYDTSAFKLKPWQRVVELLRPWLLAGLYTWAALMGWWLLAVPLALACCLSAFVQMHDAIHNALGLGRGWNRLALSASALLLLKSGHGLQVTHLRHHGKCLTADDPEGMPANWTLRRVFTDGPYHIFSLRLHSLRMAPRTRGVQLLESGLTLLMLGLFIWLYMAYGVLAGLVYWGVAFVLSASMPLWASYIPHHLASRNPLRQAGERRAGMFTPVVSSFAFHHLHHTYPRIPTALLPKAARELPPPTEDTHHHGQPHTH